MILSDRTIREQIESGRIGIEPLGPNAIQPSSVDVRLDRTFRIFLNHTRTVIDVKEDLADLTQQVEIEGDRAFILHPGEFVLASTREVITLPDDVVARIEGKSSLARLGLLIHSSLPGSEPVYVRTEDGAFRPVPIEEVVGKQLQAHVVAFDPTTFEVGFHPITGWYEGPPDRIYEIELESGRRVRVTAGHNVFTRNPLGLIEKVRTGDLRPGEHIAIPARLPTLADPGDAVRLPVAEMVPDPAPTSLAVSGPAVRACFETNDADVAAALADAGFGSTVSHYRRHDTLPYSVAHQLGVTSRLSPLDRICWRGGTNSIPAMLDVDADLAWTLGMFVATGHRRRHRVVISNTDQARLDRVERTWARLGLTVHRSAGAVAVGSIVLSALLDWIGTGDTASTKRVPPIVYAWPSDLIEAFLEGLVDGGGSCDGGRASLRTTSDGLVGGLLVLYGLVGRRAGSQRRRARATASSSWQVDADAGPRLVDGDVAWDRVVAIRDTGSTETIFDLQVRPGGRKIENFLAGHGGVFVSNTAGFIDPGFSGHITLELANVATLPITLYPGMKIGQISFMLMTTPADVPYGSPELGSKYHGQRGPTPSRYFENFDRDATPD